MSSLLVDVQSRIAAATLQADRALEAVRLVAVSKTKPADEIRTVLIEGQRLFGENRV